MATSGVTVVVGGGCAGVLATGQLVRGRARVLLAEPSNRLGRGVAYGSCQPWHLLNSPAGSMSADPRQPEQFLDWLRARDMPADPGEFAPRSVYGDYLSDSLATIARDNARLSLRRDAVVGLRSRVNGIEVAFAASPAVVAENVVLALGNPVSSGPARALASPHYLSNPWRAGALDEIPSRGPVLLIGTGLTAVDVMLSLARRNPSAPVVAVSRHGLLPMAHPQVRSVASRGDFSTESLRGLLRQVRLAAGRDWHATVDGLRPDVNDLWQSLTMPQQERFLRHVARHWEIHRHRMPPRVAREVAELLESRACQVHADAIMGSTATSDGGVEVSFASGAVRRFAAVVNCTGPGRLPEGANPLLRRMLSQGLVRPGPHRLGLDVDATGRVIDRSGAVNPRLWTIGSLRRGVLWETTAVPEIRQQAVDLAAAVEPAQALPRT